MNLLQNTTSTKSQILFIKFNNKKKNKKYYDFNFKREKKSHTCEESTMRIERSKTKQTDDETKIKQN